MQTTVGIFLSRAAAERAAGQLRDAGIAEAHLNMLTPGEAGEQHESVPNTAAEPPGIGKALGGVVGGAVGASTGLFGTAAVVSLVPGLGPVLASGMAVAALLGAAGGAVAGVAAGGALENNMAEGVPKDELWLYDSALRQGRTVLIVTTDDTAHRDLARRLFEEAGAESVDAARHAWGVGLTDAEDQQYQGGEGHAEGTSEAYQKGFEAALRPATRALSYEAAQDNLQRHHGDIYRDADFRRGYEQGLSYSEHIQGKWRQAAAPTTTRQGGETLTPGKDH
jgi:hypothetical protein